MSFLFKDSGGKGRPFSCLTIRGMECPFYSRTMTRSTVNCLTIQGMECPFYSRTVARSTVAALLFEGWNVLFIQGLWQGQQ